MIDEIFDEARFHDEDQPENTLRRFAGPMVRFVPIVEQMAGSAALNRRARRKGKVRVLACFSVAIAENSLA